MGLQHIPHVRLRHPGGPHVLPGCRRLQPGCTRLQGLLGLRRVDGLLAPRCHLRWAEAGPRGHPQLMKE
eukprot:scaffold10384_cov54-Phaeocystis_antarctica.AAC.2